MINLIRKIFLIITCSFLLSIVFLFPLFLYKRSYNKKDFEFNDVDFAFIKTFKNNRKLYYENEKKLKDSMTVLNVYNQKNINRGLMTPRPSNELFVITKHLPIDYWESTSQEDGKKLEITHQSFFSITKYPVTKTTSYNIVYKDLYLLVDSLGHIHTDTLAINNKKISKYYLLKNDHPNYEKTDDFDEVYLTQADGVVGFKTLHHTWIKVDK